MSGPTFGVSERQLLGGDGVDLAGPAGVAATLELGGQEGIEGVEGHLGADEPLPDAHDVGVVVGPGQPGRGHVVDGGGPDTGDLAGGHADPDAASAHPDPAVGPTLGHRPTDGLAVVRVVDRLGRVGAEVVDLVTGGPEVVGQETLELEAGMIGPDGDTHGAEATGLRHADRPDSGVGADRGDLDQNGSSSTPRARRPNWWLMRS